MSTRIHSITLSGFKSLHRVNDFRLDTLNVLIGANGAGKSNFIDFFRMLRSLARDRLQQFINECGGGDGFLYLGPKTTPVISAQIGFSSDAERFQDAYQFELAPTRSGTLQFVEEALIYKGVYSAIGKGTRESSLRRPNGSKTLPELVIGYAEEVHQWLSSCTVYHFHDTSPLSAMRRDQPIQDWERFRPDGSNIAAFLMNLKQNRPESYLLICDTIRMIAPFFDEFLLRPQTRDRNEIVRLEWNQKGSDFPFQPYHLSDGTIRFICLAVALLQPDPPALIVIDEPELGLHPFAISILADLIKSAAERTQVIISTQSPTLVDYFLPEQVVVVSRKGGQSTFERLDPQSLTEWMEEYSVGELWQKNVVRGGPTRE